MVAILEKSEHNVYFHPIVDFVEASPLRYALTFKPTVYVSHIRQFWSTARIETTKEGTKILATVDGILRTVTESSLWKNLNLKDEERISRIVPLFDTMLVPQGEGLGTSTEPHHTPSPEAQHTSYTTHSSPTLPPVTTAPIPTVTLSDTPTLRQYTRRARIAQFLALPHAVDEPASPLRDVSEAPRVTSPAADEGSMHQTLHELTALCTSLQRQHSEMVAKFEAQELEINRLKARVKLLEDREGVVAERFGDDAPIKGKNLDKREAVAERVSDDTEEMVTVLTSMDAATVLASGIAEVPTGSGPIPTAGPPATEVPTGSDVVPTAGLIFATATVVTPYTRRKGKETMVESETLKKKKIQEQMDIHMARQLEEGIERDAQRMNERIARDAKIARIHAEEELQIMIDGLDRKAWKFKRKGIRFEQESVKKLKTSEKVPEEVKSPDEVPEEKVKEMMQLVPIEEVYVEALQVKHPIIDWKVHTKGQRSFWKITRLGGSPVSYQFFVDMLKHLDREDLNQLWALVKESLSNMPPTSDKEMELWERFKCMTPDEINDIISAELPSPTKDPVGYKVVSEFMLHGPCGKDTKYAPCTTEGKCLKHYPMVFLEETVIYEDGILFIMSEITQ
nr:hypothetical protein [Tanacetum cinerariifolium]